MILRLAFAVAFSIAVLGVANAQAGSGHCGDHCGEAPEVRRWSEMVAAAGDWDVDEALSVIDCESGGDPNARNRTSGAAGLTQLNGWGAKALDLFGRHDLTDPWLNLQMAFYLWQQGGRRFDTQIGWIASVHCWAR